MKAPPGRVKQLTGYLLDEVFHALGLGKTGWSRRRLWPLFWLPAHRFAQIAATFDEIVAQAGFQAASRWLLPRYTVGSQACGIESLPPTGPLLIASNHPGAFDALVLTANIPRRDVKIIVSGVPFLRGLDALKAHFIYSADDAHGRMQALRSALRHLQAGGALLLFASGLVDPDPAFLPGAAEALERWSGSLDIFMRQVPETQVVISIVSGVLAPRFMRSPLVRRGRMKAWQRQRIAEYLQVMQQLIFGWKFGLAPRVTFGPPLSLEMISDPARTTGTRPRIVDYAKNILAEHQANDLMNLKDQLP